MKTFIHAIPPTELFNYPRIRPSALSICARAPAHAASPSQPSASSSSAPAAPAATHAALPAAL